MKNTILFFLIITLTCCKQNENEKKTLASFVDYYDEITEITLKSKSTPKKNQILFMNYHLNMTEAEFDSVTKKNIKEGIMKIYKDNLYLNLEKGCKFKITHVVENNQLKIMHLQYVLEFNKNSNLYNPKYYYEVYYKILQGRYGSPICEYEDKEEQFNSVKDHGATWIKDGIVIELTESNNLYKLVHSGQVSVPCNVLCDHSNEFIQTTIHYQELSDQQKRIKDGKLADKRENVRQKKEATRRNIERMELEKEKLKKDSIYNSNF
ncbi:hypothetical protein [Flavobacterium sp. GSP6]|uniref:hypothetical protein n=1 Tax=Flavobacterium sp. GSP6 TaxID=2497488 RepID=UPI000F85DBA8|nr:hypothetical protein [Flavobacterium sp. GSP6]RTZ09276.1 hypothetical protein EKM03_01425 [Flavobacterium sp. GSP6]